MDAPGKPSIRVRGRSFMALVLTPEPPLEDWLAALDVEIGKAATFFVERPVLLDCGLFEAGEVGLLAALPDALAARGIRVIAAENLAAEADFLPAPLSGGRATGDQDIPDPPAPAPPRSLVIDEPVRSGRQIVYPDGDVTVLGSIASGAEVMAGGSIHVYGALRGRAIAGSGGNREARIFCRRMQAELIAIDGFYMTADDMDATLLDGPVSARLEGDQMTMTALD